MTGKLLVSSPDGRFSALRRGEPEFIGPESVQLHPECLRLEFGKLRVTAEPLIVRLGLQQHAFQILETNGVFPSVP